MDMLVEELPLSRGGHLKAAMQAAGVLEMCVFVQSRCFSSSQRQRSDSDTVKVSALI